MSLLLLLFFYLLPQGVGTSEWKKVFFFFLLFIYSRTCVRAYTVDDLKYQLESNTNTHTTPTFFSYLFFFFVCVYREHIVKQGPTLSSCCVPFFFSFLYLKSKGVDIRTTTTFFFRSRNLLLYFWLGGNFTFLMNGAKVSSYKFQRKNLRQTQMESISYERQFSNHPQPMRFCPRTTNAVACVLKRKKNKGGAQYFMGYRWPAIFKRDTKNFFQIKILQNGLCWSFNLVGFPSLSQVCVCVCPFHQK